MGIICCDPFTFQGNSIIVTAFVRHFKQAGNVRQLFCRRNADYATKCLSLKTL